MELSSKQQDFIMQHSLVVLSTLTKDTSPRSILVEINKVDNDKLIITDNQMETTQQNIKTNPKVCVLISDIENYTYLKIDGEASYYDDGEYFEYVKNLPWNALYTPKWAVVIKINNIKEVA